MILDLQLEDVLQLRKPHPCGGYQWRVVRLGADIGLRCLTCGHKVLLPRSTVERRTKLHFDSAGQRKPPPAPAPPAPEEPGGTAT